MTSLHELLHCEKKSVGYSLRESADSVSRKIHTWFKEYRDTKAYSSLGLLFICSFCYFGRSSALFISQLLTLIRIELEFKFREIRAKINFAKYKYFTKVIYIFRISRLRASKLYIICSYFKSLKVFRTPIPEPLRVILRKFAHKLAKSIFLKFKLE